MRDAILIVDDVAFNRDLLRDILEDDFSIIEAVDGEDALAKIDAHIDELCVVLLDLVMPKKSGQEVLQELHRKGITEKLPVLIISGEQSLAIERACFNWGIVDFVRKPFDDMLVKQRVKNASSLFSYKLHLEEQVAEQTEELTAQNEKLGQINTQIIELLGDVVEARSMESGLHVKRVKCYTEVLAYELMERYPEYGLTKDKIRQIVVTSALHDMGKVLIQDSILLKPGRLTDEEFAIMKAHTTRGSEFLQKAKELWTDDMWKMAVDICLHHHERYDGRGYPHGLKGDQISIAAQIVSVADVYDALVHKRVYKAAYSEDQAFRMILNGECGVFNPKLMECFLHVRGKMQKITGELVDE